MKELISKKHIIIIIAAILLIIAIIVGIVALNKKGKIIKLKEDNSFKLDFTDKVVEDDYQKVAVKDIAVAENYFFIKYDIDIKEKGKKLLDAEISNDETFSYTLNRIITINGEEIDKTNGESYQIAQKIDEDTLSVYDIVKVDSIPDKFNIDIDFIKTNEGEYVTQAEREMEKSVYQEHMETTQIDEWNYQEDDEEDDESLEITALDPNETPIPVDMTEVDHTVEIELAGTKTFRGTKQEASQNVEVKYLNGELNATNLVVKPNFIVTTPYDRFLVVSSTIDNISQATDNDLDPDLFKIDVQDKEKNTKIVKYSQNYNLVDTGRLDSENDEILKAEITSIISLGKDTQSGSLYLQPFFFKMLYEEDDQEAMLNRLTWYPLENKEYSEENEFGGKVLVKSVEEKDDQIYFEIERKGFVPLMDRLIVIRNPENTLGFCVATEAIVDGDKLTVYFEKQQIDAVNENCSQNNIEFTIMEPISYEIVTDRIEINL